MQLKQFLYSTDKTEIQAYLWATEDCSVPFNAISGLLVKALPLYLHWYYEEDVPMPTSTKKTCYFWCVINANK